MNAAKGCATSILGGLSALSLCVLLVACATVPQIADQPAPTEESVQSLILQWDAAERTNPKCPEAYRAVFVSALKALNNSLAETARERARQ
jgi:predicted component of type VI protein secretion system